MAEMRRMQSDDDDDPDTEKIFFLKFILTLTGEVRPKPPSCVVVEETLGVCEPHYDVACNVGLSELFYCLLWVLTGKAGVLEDCLHREEV